MNVDNFKRVTKGVAVHNPEETYVLCHCARPFIFIALYMFNRGNVMTEVWFTVP